MFAWAVADSGMIWLRITAYTIFLIAWAVVLAGAVISSWPAFRDWGRQALLADRPRSDMRARMGLLLQFVGLLLATSLMPMAKLRSDALTLVVTMLLAPASARLFWQAVRLTPKDRNQLVTSGPYAWVRHPIYAAIGGLLIASGLLAAKPAGLLTGIAVYLAGSELRMRAEESSLLQEQGRLYRAYQASVPYRLLRPLF